MSESEIEIEKQDIDSFYNRLKALSENYKITLIFTPKGEIANLDFYGNLILKVEKLKNIEKIVIQTNLSGNMGWIQNLSSKKVVFWATFHPEEISVDDFLQNCKELYERAILFTVGAVGISENKKQISDLRKKLPRSVYFWINGYKDIEKYYLKKDIYFFSKIDNNFEINLKNYNSYGESCSTGENSILVEGNGNIRRCHLDSKVIGDFYKDNLDEILYRRKCRNKLCDCYITYIHMDKLKLRKIYGNSIAERVPAVRRKYDKSSFA